MKKIGIISDTHKKVEFAKSAIDMLINHGVDFIVHAGDIVEVEVLELLKNCGKDYIAVYGNNDAHLFHYHKKYNLVQEPHYFKLENTKFKLMHLPFYMVPDAEVIIYGHTHMFESTMKENGTLYLNSGEVCARKKPLIECMMLEVDVDTLNVTHFSKKSKELKFNHKKFFYNRKKNGR